MSDKFTHSICDSCWDVIQPVLRTPHRVKDPESIPCCMYLKTHTSGIFLRALPSNSLLKCFSNEGIHKQ